MDIALPTDSRRARPRGLAMRVVALLLCVGLVPLSLGVLILQHQSRAHERSTLDRSLQDEATREAASLESYFERARAIILVTAHNAAFQQFYALPGSRDQKLAAGGPVVSGVHSALRYIEHLYPTSIGEICFIDAAGPENARVVHERQAKIGELTKDESGNPFFAPTFALKVGQVYQARPYVSPDTGDWVISNSTLVPFPDRAKHAIVHFEVTIESFRRQAAASSGHELVVVDAQSGAVVFDSELAQRRDAALGRPGDARFRELVRVGRQSGTIDLAGLRAAYKRLPERAGNANDWYVVALAKPAGRLNLAANLSALGALAAAVVLAALFMARRYARVSHDLAVTRELSAEELHASEQRYRELWKEAEAARGQLSEQNEKLLELDRMKDEFVALVSHELRTPLTSIRGYLELVLDGDAGELSPEQRRCLGVVERNSQRLLRLVGDLLFIAQLESGRLELVRAPVDLAEVVASSADAARPLAEEKEITLTVAIGNGSHTIDGDRARLGQLLDNLVSNALKFTPAGGTVTVQCARDADAVTISVADTGMGIPKDEQHRLFERFFRTSAATSSAIQGTGLGLSFYM
jgi:signal transduction histidine kinase